MNLLCLSFRAVPAAGIASILSTFFIAQLPATAENSTCTIQLIEGVLPAAIVPGRLVVSDDHRAFSSLLANGSSVKVGLGCSQDFTVSINNNNIQQMPSTGETEFAVIEADVTDIEALSLLGVGETLLPRYVLTIDLTATEPDTEIIGAGDYSFVVPVTISGN